MHRLGQNQPTRLRLLVVEETVEEAIHTFAVGGRKDNSSRPSAAASSSGDAGPTFERRKRLTLGQVERLLGLDPTILATATDSGQNSDP